jgi:hypothetical protein
VHLEEFFLCQEGDMGFIFHKMPTSLFFIPVIPEKYDGNLFYFLFLPMFYKVVSLEWSVPKRLTPLNSPCVWVLISGTLCSLDPTLLQEKQKLWLEVIKVCVCCYVFWASLLAIAGEFILHFVYMFFKYVPLLVLMVFGTNRGKPKNWSVINFDTISTELLAFRYVQREAAT